MASLEERLPTVIAPSGLGVKDSVVADNDSSLRLEYYAKPENYQGSNIHSIRRIIYAKQDDAPMVDDHDSVPPSTTIGSRKLPTGTSANSKSSRNSVRLSASRPGHSRPQQVRPKTTGNFTNVPSEITSRTVIPSIHIHGTSEEYQQNTSIPPDDVKSFFGVRTRSPEVSSGRSSFSGQGSSSLQLAARKAQANVGRSISRQQARDRIQHNIKLVLIVIKWISSLSDEDDHSESVKNSVSQKTFTDMAQEAVESNDVDADDNLRFNLSYFKTKKEINITNEVKYILSIPPQLRTQEQIQMALYDLQSLESFAEYPLHMQLKLVQVGWFQHVPPGRVIIRQGHLAENFYFILSGEAMVKFLEHNGVTGENQLRTAALLRKGSSFGELALLHHSRRTATVVSQDTVQLLTIGREDFFNIIIGQHRHGEISDHAKYISTLDFMKDWPVQKLIHSPECCIFHYFKRGTVMVRDSNSSDWLYIIKSGSCRVIKQLQQAVPRTRLEHKKAEDQAKYSATLRAHTAFADSILMKSAIRQNSSSVKLEKQKPRERCGIQSTSVFVQVEVLKPGDVFGLRTINFEQEYETGSKTSVSLVSNGAECVMLSKKFYMDHASPQVQRMVRHQIQTYPSQFVLQDNYQTKVEWLAYKKCVINSSVLRRHVCSGAIRLSSNLSR